MRRGVRRVAYRLPRERRGAPLVLQRRRAPRRVSRKPVHALPPVRVAIRAQLALALALALCLACGGLIPARRIISGGEIGRRAEACVLARRPGPPAEAARLDDVEPLPDVLLRPMRPPPRRPAAAPPAFMFRMVGTRKRRNLSACCARLEVARLNAGGRSWRPHLRKGRLRGPLGNNRATRRRSPPPPPWGRKYSNSFRASPGKILVVPE